MGGNSSTAQAQPCRASGARLAVCFARASTYGLHACLGRRGCLRLEKQALWADRADLNFGMPGLAGYATRCVGHTKLLEPCEGWPSG